MSFGNDLQKSGGGTEFELIGTLNIVVVQTKPKAPEPTRTPLIQIKQNLNHHSIKMPVH